MRQTITILAVTLALALACSSSAPAFMERYFTLGDLCSEAKIIAVLRIERVDQEKKLLVFQRVAHLKGGWPVERLEQSFKTFAVHRHPFHGKGLHPLDQAAVGQEIVWFADDQGAVALVGRTWYRAHKTETGWAPVSTDFVFNYGYHGVAKDLIPALKAILAGREVIVEGEGLVRAQGRPQTFKIKASLKRLGFDPQRDRAD